MKILQRFLTAICIILATCCVLNIKDILSETSQTFGSFDHYDLYEDFNVFEIEENLVFYNEDGTYKFSKTYPIKVDFNGSDNEYNLFVNNKPCDTIKSTAGSLYGIYGLSFYDINNQYICDFDLQIRYTFYASNFELSIETTCNSDELKYLNEYLNVNGFNLRIIEKVYYIAEEDVLSKVYVSFYDENDNLLGVQNTLYNQKLATPTYNVPEKTGYTFKGWTIDGKTLVDFSTYKFTKNVKLKPLYEINTYTVTFKNGSEIISTQTVEYGNNATAPAVTPAIGYTFSGWNKSLKNITGDAVISATFNKIQYTIHYYDDGEKLLETKTYVIGDSISYTPPELTGYTFRSWNEDHYAFYSEYDINLGTLTADFISNHFVNSTELSVYARYEINNYSVAYEDTNLTVRESSSDGYKLSSGNSVQYNSKIYISVTSKENYTFVIKVNGIEASNNSLVTITENTTITVEWTYVAPAKSWKTIFSGSKDCISSTYIEGLKTGCDFRITLASVKGNEWGADVSYSLYSRVVSDSSQITLFSSYGDYVYASFSITKDNYLTINFSSDDDDLYAYSVNITLIEQYC